MLENIPRYPDIPENLHIAASQKKLVPFIGAGVSRLRGYPDWEKFADQALRFFVAEGKLNHAQFDQISGLSPRVKLSFAVNLEERYNLLIDFKKILSLNSEKNQNKDIYRHVLRLFQFSKTFITTNYDEELDGQLPPVPPQINEENESISKIAQSTTLIYQRDDIDVSNLDRKNAVIHIHGSVCDRTSMVLTTSDYLDRYYGHQVGGLEPRENKFLTFLEQLFKSRNVLFIGYGSDELEILEYVIKKSIAKLPITDGQITDDRNNRHYILQGFFTHQLELAKSMESYFQSLGISLLPFSLDIFGWESLIDVIKHLNGILQPGRRLALAEYREMANLLPTTE